MRLVWFFIFAILYSCRYCSVFNFFKCEVQENVVQADWCLKWCTYTNTAWVMHWLCDVEFWSTMLGSCWVHKFWVITIMYMLKAMEATLVYKHDIFYIYISCCMRHILYIVRNLCVVFVVAYISRWWRLFNSRKVRYKNILCQY